MPSVYRISRSGREPVVDVSSPDAIEGIVQAGDPGRYHIDEISSRPLSSGHTARRWGTAMKFPDGRFMVEPDPQDWT
jgi:hypothetical protein